MGTGEFVVEASSNGYWPVERNICDQHFRDPELVTALRDNLTEESCDFCDRTGTPGTPFAAHMDAIMPTLMVGIRALYEPASESGIDYMDTEITSKYTDYDVVYDVVDAEDEVLNAVAHNLTCDDWLQSNWQRPRPDQEMFYGWEAFKSIIKHSLRFLFAGHPVDVDDQPSGARFLHDLIEMIGQIDGWSYRVRRRCIAAECTLQSRISRRRAVRSD
ncbi:hypothetical protein GCM10007304_46700 [Rhodococcoides trifolii]|uniref:HEPN/RES N-terminal domain-containing protein n=1 Tax=Rhodococcoides trifolii TaxID=908250 RepID=A0A917LIN8_9NOCA|nr:HEPN-associated N-terminal domain-containing protein [Rhodococcus trifolii]GGG27533.1 hypothetical protein GCM10007304_46700 [Rhodococcus trifolii]